MGLTSMTSLTESPLATIKTVQEKVYAETSVRLTPVLKTVDGAVKMSEKDIERKFVRMVKNAGGIAPKFVSPGFDGMPDRIVLLPGGHFGFVEVKDIGQKPRPLQVARHRLLRALGFQVYVLDHPDQIPGIIQRIGGDAE